MTPQPVMPGVPSAGHVGSNGAWHPGSVDGCDRCEPDTGLLFRCRSCGQWTDPDLKHTCQTGSNPRSKP